MSLPGSTLTSPPPAPVAARLPARLGPLPRRAVSPLPASCRHCEPEMRAVQSAPFLLAARRLPPVPQDLPKHLCSRRPSLSLQRGSHSLRESPPALGLCDCCHSHVPFCGHLHDPCEGGARATFHGHVPSVSANIAKNIAALGYLEHHAANQDS